MTICLLSLCVYIPLYMYVGDLLKNISKLESSLQDKLHKV